MFKVMQFGGFVGPNGTGTGTATPPPTANLIGWYDFSDVSVLTTSGTFVTAISDKSTSSFNATATISGTATHYPSYQAAVQNGLGALKIPDGRVGTASFTDVSRGLDGTGTVVLPLPGGATTVMVANYIGTMVTGTLTNEPIPAYGGVGNAVAGVQGIVSGGTGNWTGFVKGGVPSITAGTYANGWRIFVVKGTQTGTVLSVSLRLDGGTATAAASSLSVGVTTSTTIPVIGHNVANDGSNQDWNGYIGEVRYFSASLSTSDVFKEEGYLAWKWGLQANLPSSHPYKNAPP